MIIKGIEGKTNAQIKFEISQGRRFVYFEYGFFASKKYSGVYYVQPGKSVYALGLLFSLISLIFGWWSLRGPFYTVTSLITNFKGGRDITSQIGVLLDDGESYHVNNGYIALKYPEKNSRRKNNLDLTKNAFRSGFLK